MDSETKDKRLRELLEGEKRWAKLIDEVGRPEPVRGVYRVGMYDHDGKAPWDWGYQGPSRYGCNDRCD